MKKEAFLLDNTEKNSYHIDIKLVFIKNLVNVFRLLETVAYLLSHSSTL